MLKKFLLFLMVVVVFNICDVSAMNIGESCYLVNNNQLCITEDEYINLVNLGYSEFEVANLSIEEYEENRNLKADLVSKKFHIIMEIWKLMKNRITNFKIKVIFLHLH